MSDEIIFESELEVVFSLMSDKDLIDMNARLEDLIREKAFEVPKFPISCGGIRFVQSIALFSYWMRRGQGVRIQGGEVVVCELEESPFVQKYWEKEIRVPAPLIINNEVEEVQDGELGKHNEEDGEWV